MDDELVVTVDGLRMFGRPGLGPFVLVKDGLDGWDDGVPMRGEKIARAQKHGAYFLPRFQESRTVTLTGVILAGSSGDQILHGRRVSGLLASGRTGRVQVQRKSGTLWTDAYLEAAPRVDPRRGTWMSDFQVQLWCPDARLFGETHSFSASVGSPATAFHWGNHVAMPKFTVAGSMPDGYTLWVNGSPFVVTRPLVAGTPSHVIDFDDGRLRVGGAVVHGGLGVTNLPGVQPGTSALLEITPATTGTATASIALKDTFI